MSDINSTRKKCHSCIDNFMARSDLHGDYKKKRVGQAIAYMQSARKLYTNEKGSGYKGEYIKDDRGRCHAEENKDGYRAGQFIPCPLKQGSRERALVGQSRDRVPIPRSNFGSRERVPVSRPNFGSRERVGQGYKGSFIRDSRGRCHAEEDKDGYRSGQFIPCPNRR